MKATRSTPWMKFYPSDWRSDPKLKLCSFSARGLWIEMIALMHESTPYGHLIVAGKQPSELQLCNMLGGQLSDIQNCMNELESAQVFSRTKAGIIYSRRMVNDEKKAGISRKNGKKGGNPKLAHSAGYRDFGKGGVNPRDKAQIPEARDQRPDKDLSLTSGSTTPPTREAMPFGIVDGGVS